MRLEALYALLALWVMYEIIMVFCAFGNSNLYKDYLKISKSSWPKGIVIRLVGLHFNNKRKRLKKLFDNRTVAQSKQILVILKELQEFKSKYSGRNIGGTRGFEFINGKIVDYDTEQILSVQEIELYIYNYLLISKQLESSTGDNQKEDLAATIRVYEDVYGKEKGG